MATDAERREVAARFRQITHTSSAESMICAYLDALGVPGYMDWVEIAESIADYIEPEPEAERTWHDFSDELPPAGVSVLCRGKNGAYYVGKPVTSNGKGTRKVWVPRGDQYRTPEKWMEVNE